MIRMFWSVISLSFNLSFLYSHQAMKPHMFTNVFHHWVINSLINQKLQIHLWDVYNFEQVYSGFIIALVWDFAYF